MEKIKIAKIPFELEDKLKIIETIGPIAKYLYLRGIFLGDNPRIAALRALKYYKDMNIGRRTVERVRMEMFRAWANHRRKTATVMPPDEKAKFFLTEMKIKPRKLPIL